MTTDHSLLAQGIAAAKAGDKGTARLLLSRAVRRDPDSEAAWLWLGATLDTPQGRAFCLRRALALNPGNPMVQRGLRALEKVPPATALVAQPALVMHPLPETAAQAPPTGVAPTVQPGAMLARQRRFWQLLIACLSAVAIGLLGILAYTMIAAPDESGKQAMAAALPTLSLAPLGTLRPTFTATPTSTPMPTPTPTPTCTCTASATATPNDTATATPSPTRRRSTKPLPTATPPAETPRSPPPPRSLDPRLASLGVRLEPAPVRAGQPYWYLVEARWADQQEAGGKHSIFVEVLNAEGQRALGQVVIVQWPDGSVALPVEDRAPPDWAVDFGMYNTLGSYSVSVGGSPSDRIVGLGLGTAEEPYMKVHTCFYLIFRWVY